MRTWFCPRVAGPVIAPVAMLPVKSEHSSVHFLTASRTRAPPRADVPFARFPMNVDSPTVADAPEKT